VAAAAAAAAAAGAAGAAAGVAAVEVSLSLGLTMMAIMMSLISTWPGFWRQPSAPSPPPRAALAAASEKSRPQVHEYDCHAPRLEEPTFVGQ